MFEIFRFFKGHVPSFLACLALLVIQALFELALPGFMSDIVDVGYIASRTGAAIARDTRHRLFPAGEGGGAHGRSTPSSLRARSSARQSGETRSMSALKAGPWSCAMRWHPSWSATCRR